MKLGPVFKICLPLRHIPKMVPHVCTSFCFRHLFGHPLVSGLCLAKYRL